MITNKDLELAKTTTDPEIQLILVRKMIECHNNYSSEMVNPGFALFNSLFENLKLIPEVQHLMLFKYVAFISDRYLNTDRMLQYPNLAPEVFDISFANNYLHSRDETTKVLQTMEYAHPETQRKLDLWKLLG